MPARDIHFEASAPIQAPPEVIWDILTDYRRGHPMILPPSAFGDFRVEAGGRGAGTIVSFTFRVAGVKRATRHFVSTPAPGRTLIEAEEDESSRTIFTLTPVDDGRMTRLRIATEQNMRPGVRGYIERLMVSLIAPSMRAIYLDEMRRLDALAQHWPMAKE